MRFCNGIERCDPTDFAANAANRCVAGAAPDCSDGVDCTNDVCNDTTDGCDTSPSTPIDDTFY